MDGFNMDAPWGLYSKWNKPVMKRQISVWFNFYKSKQERERERESRMGVSRIWGGGVGRDIIV